MLEEQIKIDVKEIKEIFSNVFDDKKIKEISSKVCDDKKIKEISSRVFDCKMNKIISLEEIILKSNYKALIFYGDANGLPLGQGFNISDLQGRSILIKSIRLFLYVQEGGVDFFMTDGVDTNKETIPTRARIIRVFDDFINGAQIKLVINSVPSGLFPISAEGGYPADLFLDNIYYLVKEKLETLSLSVDVRVFDDISTGMTSRPFIKVLLECYTYR